MWGVGIGLRRSSGGERGQLFEQEGKEFVLEGVKSMTVVKAGVRDD